MLLPINKRRLTVAFFPPKTKENRQGPMPVFSSFVQNSHSVDNPHLPHSCSPKRLFTENRNSESKTQKEASDYLQGLFDFIRAEFLVEHEEGNPVRAFRSFSIEKNSDVPGNKAGKDNKKEKKIGWWKSMVARSCDKLRTEKRRLRNANLKDLFSQFWNQKQEFQWKIEHKQDPYAFLSVPVSASYRV